MVEKNDLQKKINWENMPMLWVTKIRKCASTIHGEVGSTPSSPKCPLHFFWVNGVAPSPNIQRNIYQFLLVLQIFKSEEQSTLDRVYFDYTTSQLREPFINSTISLRLLLFLVHKGGLPDSFWGNWSESGELSPVMFGKTGSLERDARTFFFLIALLPGPNSDFPQWSSLGSLPSDVFPEPPHLTSPQRFMTSPECFMTSS